MLPSLALTTRRALTSHRHAMMSALSAIPASLLKDAPPVVVPTGESVTADAASPQLAARPPPVPKAPRPRPTIRSTKAALFIVRLPFLLTPLHPTEHVTVDTRSRAATSRSPQWPDTPTHTDWGTQQGLCRPFLSSRIRRQAWEIRRSRRTRRRPGAYRQQSVVLHHWQRDGLERGCAEVRLVLGRTGS